MRLHQWFLRQQPDFLKLWSGQTISQFGSGITASALPLTAILLLGASATQMGLLVAAEAAPFAIFGLFAGVWVDRLRRRPLMIAADVGRAFLLLSIPVAAVVGRLHVLQLFLVAALVGVLTVFFDVAYQSILPGLLPRERLLAANSRLAASSAMAEIVTPGLTGALVQLVSAPFTIVLDAISFLCSAGSIALLGTEEPSTPSRTSRRIRHEIREGLATVVRSPLLRAFAAASATRSFFGNWIGALYALYVLQDLTLGPVLLGASIGVGGASNLLGTFVVEPITRRLGLGRAVVVAVLVGGMAAMLIPLAHGPMLLGFGLLVLSQAFDAIHPIYDVNVLTVRQSITPPNALGRVNAATQTLEMSFGPLGAVVGGVLAGHIGVRPTLYLAAIGLAASVLWLVCPPLPDLRALPATGDGNSSPVA